MGAAGHHLGGQQSDQQYADDAADEVHADDVQRVVIAEPEFRPTANEQTMPAASPTMTAPRVFTVPHDGVIATRPATTPEAAPKVVGLPSRIRSTGSSQHAEATGHERVQEDRRGHAVGGQRGTGVEAEPAEPQQPDTEQHEREVVRAHGVLLETDPGAEHKRQRECRRSGDDFDDQAAGVVQRPELEQPAAGPHTQCATTAYTATVHSGTKTIQAANLARSAIAPLTSAAVTIANPSWKVANKNSGTDPRAVSGSMPSIPMWARLPTRPAAASSEKAME